MTFPPVTLNLDALRLNLLRQTQPSRVHIFEHGVADEVEGELVRCFDLTTTGWERDVGVQRFIGRWTSCATSG